MLSNIQILRAFAALNVVLYHIINTSISYGHNIGNLNIIRGWGANGVDIFFVISGFVMAYTHENSKKTASQFLINRIQRIVPIYWIVTIFVASLSILIPSLFREIAFDLHRVVASILFSSKLSGFGDPLIYVGWTLEYEMAFYIIFAISILLSPYCSNLLTTTILLGILYIAGLFEAIVFEFLFGILCAKLFLRNRPIGLGAAYLSIGIIMLLGSIGSVNISYRVIIWGIPSFLIVLGCVNVKQISNRYALYLGSASYSIYLCQSISIPAFYKMLGVIGISLSGWIIIPIVFLFATASGCIFYQFVEKPISRRLKRA